MFIGVKYDISGVRLKRSHWSHFRGTSLRILFSSSSKLGPTAHIPKSQYGREYPVCKFWWNWTLLMTKLLNKQVSTNLSFCLVTDYQAPINASLIQLTPPSSPFPIKTLTPSFCCEVGRGHYLILCLNLWHLSYFFYFAHFKVFYIFFSWQNSPHIPSLN